MMRKHTEKVDPNKIEMAVEQNIMKQLDQMPTINFNRLHELKNDEVELGSEKRKVIDWFMSSIIKLEEIIKLKKTDTEVLPGLFAINTDKAMELYANQIPNSINDLILMNFDYEKLVVSSKSISDEKKKHTLKELIYISIQHS